MQGTRLSFRTQEDAIHFAEKQGWDYYMYVFTERCVVSPVSDASNSQQPEVKRIPPKNYAENYVYKPNKLRICRTK